MDEYSTYRYEVDPGTDTVISRHGPKVRCDRARGAWLTYRLSGDLVVSSLVAHLIAGAAGGEGVVSRRDCEAGRGSCHRRKEARRTKSAARGSVHGRDGSCRTDTTRPAACHWRIESRGTDRARSCSTSGSIAGRTRSTSQ